MKGYQVHDFRYRCRSNQVLPRYRTGLCETYLAFHGRGTAEKQTEAEMDVQATFGRSSVSKMAVAFVLSITAALLLGGAGGYLAKGLTVDQAGVQTAPSVSANQPIAGGDSYRATRGGVQSGDDGSSIEYELGAIPSRPGGPRP